MNENPRTEQLLSEILETQRAQVYIVWLTRRVS
jgi:hypothetical protein